MNLRRTVHRWTIEDFLSWITDEPYFDEQITMIYSWYTDEPYFDEQIVMN
jgi:hypothetical protein